MTKIKTTKGIINNNTIKHKITRDTATIFNFCIDDVTLEDDTLTVTCTTLFGDTVEYSLDISKDTKELPSVLENLNVAGDVNLFLALAYRIYESGLEQGDTPTGDCTELQERIAELEAQLPLPTDVIWGITHLSQAYVKVQEEDVNTWQEAEDKTSITLQLLEIDIPFTDLNFGAGEEQYYETSVKINNITDSFNLYNVYNQESGGRWMQGFLDTLSATPIPISDDHLLNFEITLAHPHEDGENVTIVDTLNLDTKTWTGGGGILLI